MFTTTTFILSERTRVTTTELSRYPRRIFEKLKRTGHLYSLLNSQPIGIFISSNRLEKMPAETRQRDNELLILQIYTDKYLNNRQKERLKRELIIMETMLM